MIKHIFFDFDGVLAESVNIKTDAFYEMFLKYGIDIAEKVKEHHLENGGISRFEKFKFYHKNFLKNKIVERDIQLLATKFSDLVVNKVIDSNEVKGTSKFLIEHFSFYKYYIITGTPTEEMNAILKGRKMDNFFKDVFGSPCKKSYWTEFIIKRDNLDRTEIVFVGDALADYSAAKFSDIKFILRETNENHNLFKFFKGDRIKNIDDLSKIIKKIK